MKFLLIGLLLIASTQSNPVEKEIEHLPGDGRIIGGSVARIGQFPFVVAIYALTPEAQFFCGGSILNHQWILTSARCVEGATLFTIQLSSNSLVSNDPNRIKVATSEYVMHPNYNSETLENDIGLIKLRLPITYSEYVRNVILPTQEIPDFAPAVAAGWGQVNSDDPGPVNNLMYVSVATISTQECRVVYGAAIVDTMVCVEGNFNQGACKGDSGTPLVQYLSPEASIQVGVNSFLSSRGCDSTDPSGYTRIFPYVDWIQSVTQL